MPLNFSAFTTMALSKEAVNPKESPATGAKLSKGKSDEKSDFHPLVAALVRVDPLAGAPALDAHLFEGELASSPVEKALGVLWSWPLWVSRALSVISTRLCHGQRVEKINNNHDQRTCSDCQLLGGVWPPPFGGDLERVDPLADASVAHLLFQEVKTASSLVVPVFGGLLSHR